MVEKALLQQEQVRDKDNNNIIIIILFCNHTNSVKKKFK